MTDEREVEALIARRRLSGGDRFDEVWDGIYVMSPLASNEHQRIVGVLARALAEVAPGEARVLPGANVSGRDEGWEHDYRCPDVVVVLPGSRARDARTHWVGGPDLLFEVVSPGDRSHDKLPFYAALGVREVVFVDRDSKAVEAFRLSGDTLVACGTSTREAPSAVALEALPVTLTWGAEPEPHVLLADRQTGRSFRI